MFNRGDAVQIIANAQYVNNKLVSKTYFDTKLIVQSVEKNGYVLARSLQSPPIGVAVKLDHVVEYNEIFVAEIDPYYISLNKDVEIKAAASKESKTLKIAPKMSLFKIVNEKDGWGKLEVGAGWINLSEVDRL